MTEWVAPILVAVATAAEFTMLGETEARKSRQDAGSGTGLLWAWAIGLAAAFSAKYLAPSHAGPGAWAIPAGAALVLAGVVVRRWSVRALGEHFTRWVDVKTDQPVVDTGPYGYVRHPAYSGYFLVLIGIGLSLQSWLALVSILAPNAAAVGYRIRVEERELARALGPRYEAYRRRTPALVPGLGPRGLRR